jgi:VWFA-related protein
MTKRIAFITLLLTFITTTVLAQSAGPINVQANTADTADFPTVNLAAAVRDANGVPVPDLDAAHFEILEADIDRPRPLTDVATRVNPQAQVSVILVLDISGSMQGQPLNDAKAAAVHFLAQLGENDQAALLAFADSVDFDAPDPAREVDFTSDTDPLLATLDTLQAEGGTPLYDALFKAIRLADRADLGRRAVLLLTDGVDEGRDQNTPGSQVATRDTPVQEAQRANIPIFTIGLGERADPGYLELLARATGGVYQEAPDSAVLQSLFQNVADRLKQEYVLTYTSGFDCDGETHRVEIQVDVAGRTALDSIAIGPLPDDPGCNTAAQPSPTPAHTATPGATAPIAATLTPAPAATASDVAIADAVTLTPAAAGAETGGEAGDPAVTEEEPNILLPAGGGALLLVILAVAGWRLWRGRDEATGPTCQRCGYRLQPGEAACPQCGSQEISPGLRE